MTAVELTSPVLWAGACHLAMWTAGSWLRPRLFRAQPEGEQPAEKAFLDAMLGFAGLGCAAFVLASFRILYGGILFASILVLAGAGLVRLYQARTCMSARITLAGLPMLAAIVIGLAFVPSALYPVLENDENVYHLLLPKVYLVGHAFAALPWSLYANMPHLVDLSYVFPAALGDFAAARVFVLGFVLWTFAGISPFAAESLGPWGPGLLALLYLSGRNVQWHMGLAYVEPVIGALLLGTVLCLRAFWRDRDRAGHLVVLGILAGAACASKYTVWPDVAVLFATAGVAAAAPGRLSLPRRLAFMLGSAAIVLSPWLVKNAIVTGNPLYPNLYGLLGGAHWSRIQDFQLQSYLASAGGGPRPWWRYVVLPFDLVTRPFLTFGAASFSAGVMALAAASLALPWRRGEFSTALRFLAVAGLATWAAGSQQGRFLVAWVPVLVVTAGLALARLRRRPLAFGIVLAAVAATAFAQVRWQPYRTRPVMDVFSNPRRELVARNYGHDLTDFLNGTVPAGGGVLSLWENRLYFLDRPCVADSVFEAPSILARLREMGDPDAFAQELAREGFTHVVINPGLLGTYMGNGFPERIVDDAVYPLERLHADRALLERFVETQLERIPWSGGWAVYRLKARAPR